LANTATRLITLIMLLQGRPNQKAAELAERLGVSVRTVHRYINMLDELGIPVYSERGPHGGFSLVRGYRMPPLVFTPQEAVAVYLGTGLVEQIWGQMYREPAQGALAKLDNVLPEEQRHEVAWARRTLLATGMHRMDLEQTTPHLEKLRRAVRQRRRVRMWYRSRSQPEPVERDVDLYAMVHRWGWWYAVGCCHLRQAMRSFRLDRIAELALLEATYTIPDGFDTQRYLESEPYAKPTLRAQLRFDPAAALLALDDRPQWDSYEEQPDGAVEVTMGTPTLEWAARVALSYGPHVQVLAPPELRRLVRDLAHGVADRYGESEVSKREEGRSMSQDVHVVTVDADNVDEQGFFCYKSKRKTEGYARKLGWVRERLAEGLTIHILHQGKRSVGFVEYMPGEHTWRAVNADGYFLIHCLWVVGKAKKQGYGSRLLEMCLDDARKQGKLGVAIVTSERPWATGRKLFQKRGFERVDTAPPVFELWVKRLADAEPPSFPSDWEQRLARHGAGLTVFRSDQCPYIEHATAAALESARDLDIPAKVVELKTAKEARRLSPFPYGVFGIVYNGELLTYYYPDDKFRKKLQDRVAGETGASQ
jgi:predicted DNA-binding transcriptional regulator YafY/GNAT superfamily N-acetyltransferase